MKVNEVVTKNAQWTRWVCALVYSGKTKEAKERSTHHNQQNREWSRLG